MKIFIKVIKLNLRDQLIAAEAALLLAAFRAGIVCLPYSFLRRFLGKYTQITKNRHVDGKKIKQVAFWIHKVAPHLPCKCNCLPQALTGRLMLKFRNINSTLHLGLGKDEKKQLLAHAWLTVDDIPVTGGSDNTKLARVAYFG